jgi:hypothetical protein
MNGSGSSSQIRTVTAQPVRARILISRVFFLKYKDYDTTSILQILILRFFFFKMQTLRHDLYFLPTFVC